MTKELKAADSDVTLGKSAIIGGVLFNKPL